MAKQSSCPCTALNAINDADRRRTLLVLLAGFGLTDTVLAQDAAMVQPRAYRVVLENDKVRVLEFNGRPGMGVCGEGVHSHPAHLTIALSPLKTRYKLPDGQWAVGEAKIGDVGWFEAETHEVENISGRDTRALLIELKTAGGTKKT